MAGDCGHGDAYDTGRASSTATPPDADLLVAAANPLENIRLIENPGKNLAVIMKDSRIDKNTL